MLEAAEGPAPLLPLALLEKPNPTQPESDAPPKLILLDSALAALSAAARAAAKGSVIFAGCRRTHCPVLSVRRRVLLAGAGDAFLRLLIPRNGCLLEASPGRYE